MSTLSEFNAGLTIGVVESVSPNILSAVMTPDAPHGTALNTRAITRFPRLNGYVVIPSEAGAVIGLVTWIGVEADRSPTAIAPDIVALAAPRRRMRILPLGTVNEDATGGAVLERGVLLFPTVGDPVLLATRDQLRCLGLPETPENVRIGISPLAGGVAVRVDPDKMLARHLAILGNTGSGKSCSAALFLRRAIEAADGAQGDGPRIVVIDANGEYQQAFDDLGSVRVRRFAVEPDEGCESLRVPAWLWTSREWVAFSGAQRAAQAPFLRQALRLLRSGGALSDPTRARTFTVCRSFFVQARRRAIQVGAAGDFKQRMDAGHVISAMLAWSQRCAADETLPEAQPHAESISAACADARADSFDGRYWNPIDVSVWEAIAGHLAELSRSIEGEVPLPDVHEDDPLFFYVEDLAEAIELAALDDESASAVQWLAPLTYRLRHLMGDRRLRSIAATHEDESLVQILDNYLAPNQVTIIDVSLVPSAARSVVVAVLARLLFDAHERYRRVHQATRSTVLLMEEAHTFITKQRGFSEDDAPTSAVELCREAFERIAREGRKFGLSLMLTSQRPAELSETVLSQCNTFLVHRVVNDVDQNLLRRLVPDALGELLAELPSLPARTAILLGWASEIPTLVSIDELDERFRPNSRDPRFLSVWRSAATTPGWAEVVDHWQGDSSTPIHNGWKSEASVRPGGAVDLPEEPPF